MGQHNLPHGVPMLRRKVSGYEYARYNSNGDIEWVLDEGPYLVHPSNKWWQDHAQTAQNARDQARANGKTLDEVKKAVEETHTGVGGVAGIANNTLAAINKAQDIITENAGNNRRALQDHINNKHAESDRKQEDYAANITRIKQWLDDEEQKREKARQVQDVVRLAQSQGLLPMQGAGRSEASGSNSPGSSTPSDKAGSSGGCTHQKEARVLAEKRKILDSDKAEFRNYVTRTLRELEYHLQKSEQLSRPGGRVPFP